MDIGGLQKSTLIDYPGKVACTVFLVGCNFRCPWCYSPELVLPDKITRQSFLEESLFFEFINKRKHLLDGVVICGGEPTLYPELSEFIAKIKETGLLVKLDTNGSNPDMLSFLIKDSLIDYVAMDIKAPLEGSRYNESTGTLVDIDRIKESIDLLKSSDIDHEFRTTVVPGFHTEEDIISIAKSIGPAKKYYLQGFRAEKNMDPSMIKTKPYPEAILKEMADKVTHLFDDCKIR